MPPPLPLRSSCPELGQHTSHLRVLENNSPRSPTPDPRRGQRNVGKKKGALLSQRGQRNVIQFLLRRKSVENSVHMAQHTNELHINTYYIPDGSEPNRGRIRRRDLSLQGFILAPANLNEPTARVVSSSLPVYCQSSYKYLWIFPSFTALSKAAMES